MLSYMHQLGSEPFKHQTLLQLFELCVQKFGDKEAIVSCHDEERITFCELKRSVDHFASALVSMGLQTGERIGIWSQNRIQWIITFLAAAKAGLITVFINAHYQSLEIDNCLRTTGLKVLVADSASKYQNYYEILNKVIPNLDTFNNRINCSKYPKLKFIITLSTQKLSGTYSFNDVYKFANAHSTKKLAEREKFLQMDDPLCIIYTSGTSGKPKAAVLSHHALINCSYFITKRLGFGQYNHRICYQVPLFHAFGTITGTFAMLHWGTTVILPSLQYSPKASLKAIISERCTFICGTPTMYVDLINLQKEHCLHSDLQQAVIAGANASPELLVQMKNVLRLKQIKNLYGSTETTGVFCSVDNESDIQCTSTVGYLLDHIEIKIIDKLGQTVPLGSTGELCVRGYSNMLEYLNDTDIYSTTKSNRWFKTGDLFILYENGYGQIVGRLKDIIIRGGENIYPKEIEEFLDTNENILQSQIIGVPHKRLGEEVCAVIRLRKDKSLTLDDLQEFCKGKLAVFKIPKYLKTVDRFPVTLTGKILKSQLKETITLTLIHK